MPTPKPIILAEWTEQLGLTPTRSPSGTRYLYNPQPQDLPITLDEMPKDVFLSDLAIGHIYTTIEPVMKRKFRREELVDHFGAHQFNRDNDPKTFRRHLGRPYLDGMGRTMRRQGVPLKGQTGGLVDGPLECVTWGYGGMDPTEGGERTITQLKRTIGVKLHPKPEPLSGNETRDSTQKKALNPGMVHAVDASVPLPRSSKRARTLHSRERQLPVKPLLTRSNESPEERTKRKRDVMSEISCGEEPDTRMKGLKRENFELRRSLLEQEEREWDLTINQRPLSMLAETKKIMQQAIVQCYETALKTHEAWLVVLREEGDEEAVIELKAAIKLATKVQMERQPGRTATVTK